MKEVVIIYPHQLYEQHPAVEAGRLVVLVEEPLFLCEYELHTQKALLHRLSLKAYEQRLQKEGHEVLYVEHTELPDTKALFGKLAKMGVTTVHVVDTTDCYLEQRIVSATKTFNMSRIWYESPLFLLSRADATMRYQASRKHLANFYKQLRIDRHILVDSDDRPLGGKWSFDEDNRKSLSKSVLVPNDPEFITNAEVSEAINWLAHLPGTRYGEAAVWIPYTHESAKAWFADFLKERFSSFGDFEDAISHRYVRLFHSVLSPLINIGLLSPEKILTEVIDYGMDHQVPLNSLEGFVRQLLGWREFIRAAYECDGVAMRRSNFWRHTRPLPAGVWTADTGVLPVDSAITRSLTYGYTHHVERLMVLGNYFLLRQTDPEEVYRWFMALFVDAYDWVMVPNVYGMSQFADGGSFATKPYISGSNYIKKMSDYPKGDWEEHWTALYWNFIHTHSDFFQKNHRLSMMPKLLMAMDEQKRNKHLTTAEEILTKDVPV